jgi:hypothetical protein
MQGRGVTNYSVDKPAYEYTGSTTEFDDALIQRGIVTREQCLLAKGASVEEATRLVQECNHSKKNDKNNNIVDWQEASTRKTNTSDDDDDDDDDSFIDDEDDEIFLQRYREQRMQELKKQHQQEQQETAKQITHSNATLVQHISRDEWKEKVNEASTETWVVVTLVATPVGGSTQTSAKNNHSSASRDDKIIQELHNIGREYDTAAVSLVTVNYIDAIPNWPIDRVPSMFAYRNGIKQHEWIASKYGQFPSKDILLNLFRSWGII